MTTVDETSPDWITIAEDAERRFADLVEAARESGRQLSDEETEALREMAQALAEEAAEDDD